MTLVILSWMFWSMKSMVRALLWIIRMPGGLVARWDDEWEAIGDGSIKLNDELFELSVRSTEGSVLQHETMKIYAEELEMG